MLNIQKRREKKQDDQSRGSKLQLMAISELGETKMGKSPLSTNSR